LCCCLPPDARRLLFPIEILLENDRLLEAWCSPIIVGALM
jgi:hypothetical protein